ncbi:MAG: DNA-formamidopyrimidine glycosylase [Ignavibacteria bacterium]|nr:DNA-formamidopyrimidine glycosylase [Ignavibacteria bacterium]
MPELPDLLYIQSYLKRHVQGRTVAGALVKQPVVLRVAVTESFEEALKGKRIQDIHLHGPFLRFSISGRDLILNLMLAGRLQHQRAGEKADGYLCFSLILDDGSALNFCDQQRMGKAYLVEEGDYALVPRYGIQGVDVLSAEFTLDRFRELTRRHSRKQVRVFINDHTILSAVGNAYADEILFEAKIHPKTFVARLTEEDCNRLYEAVRSVLLWGIDEVAKAAAPIQVRVRNHLRVRNRKGEPCPRCGTTIRREGVRGHDVFFCPVCQPASRVLFLDWRRI